MWIAFSNIRFAQVQIHFLQPGVVLIAGSILVLGLGLQPNQLVQVVVVLWMFFIVIHQVNHSYEKTHGQIYL